MSLLTVILPAAGKGKNPDAPLFFLRGAPLERDELSVGRPIRREEVIVRSRKRLLTRSPVGIDPVGVRSAAPVGRKRDPGLIRRPERPYIVFGIKRQSGGDVPH